MLIAATTLDLWYIQNFFGECQTPNFTVEKNGINPFTMMPTGSNQYAIETGAIYVCIKEYPQSNDPKASAWNEMSDGESELFHHKKAMPPSQVSSK